MPTATLSAAQLAELTPADRNRVVDLLRAAAILVVVLGHWLMAAVYIDAGGELHRGDLLEIAAWTQPLTWALQVMPVFFLVGGYANAMSWRAARRRGETYGGWLRTRLRRLVLPVLPLLAFWAVLAPGAHAAGVDADLLRIASRASLVPTWFLAAYVVVVALAPLTLRAWERLGWTSIVIALALGGLVDFVCESRDLLAVGFLNYVIVWSAVHMLGYAWLDGQLASGVRRVALIAVGLGGLWLLTVEGPYAVSMVGVSTDEINNAFPTRVTQGFLGLMQAGVVLTAEPLLQRLAARRRVWLATVVVNGRIMSIYLWHLTMLGVLVALSMSLGGLGLHHVPDTGAWWATRPLYFAALAALTVGAVAIVGRFESPAVDLRPAPTAARPVLAMLGVCAGLGALAYLGIARDGVILWYLPLIPIAACLLGGVVRLPGRGDRSAAA